MKEADPTSELNPPPATDQAPPVPAIGHGWRAALGTVQILAAEVFGLLAGVAISITLTRQLGPEGYGLYSVAVQVALWVEQTITSMFYLPTVKFLAEGTRWREMGFALVRTQFGVSAGAALLVAALAGPLAAALRSPPLAPYLRVLALSIAIAGLTRGYQAVLVGRGAFGRSTLPGFVYWLVRLALVLLLLRLGLSVWAGIWALTVAAAVELLGFGLLVQPQLVRGMSFPMRNLFGYSAPLFLNSMALRLLTHIDLLWVQALAGADAAGWYSAAQSLTLIPLGFLSAALSQPLLSTLSRLRGQEEEEARAIVVRALRFLLCLAPFAALVAGAAQQVVLLIYGVAYRPTAPVLAWLIFGALALAIVGVCSALLTAAGKPGWALRLTAPLLPVAACGHWLLVPRYGALAAAAVTTVSAALSAVGCLAAVTRIWHVRLPLRTAARSGLVTVVAFALGALWPVRGALVLLKLAVLGGVVMLALLLLGEMTPEERRQLRTLVRRENLQALLLRHTGATAQSLPREEQPPRANP